jgi:hypothetical protein
MPPETGTAKPGLAPGGRSAVRSANVPALALGAVAVAGLAVLHVRDPNGPGSYGVCPFKLLTGLDCPGCGSLRAIHALTDFDLATAIDRNLLLVVAAPLLVLAWLGALFPALGRKLEMIRPRWFGRLVLAAVVGFWVVRNLPGVPLLGSGLGW